MNDVMLPTRTSSGRCPTQKRQRNNGYERIKESGRDCIMTMPTSYTRSSSLWLLNSSTSLSSVPPYRISGRFFYIFGVLRSPGYRYRIYPRWASRSHAYYFSSPLYIFTYCLSITFCLVRSVGPGCLFLGRLLSSICFIPVRGIISVVVEGVGPAHTLRALFGFGPGIGWVGGRMGIATRLGGCKVPCCGCVL